MSKLLRGLSHCTLSYLSPILIRSPVSSYFPFESVFAYLDLDSSESLNLNEEFFMYFLNLQFLTTLLGLKIFTIVSHSNSNITITIIEKLRP